MAWSRILLATIGACAVMVCPGAAQWVEPGARVRVSGEHAPRLVGRFVRRIGDTLEIEPENRLGIVRLPLGQVRRLEVSRGRTTGAKTGMVVGILTGLGLAAVITLGHPDGAGDLGTQADLFKVAAVGLGSVGLVSGVIIGSFTTHETWGRAELRAHLIGQDAYGARAGLHFRVAF